MASMTFRVDDQSTETPGQPAIWVTLTENGDGSITITTRIEGGITGDLRGIFFDVASEDLLGSMSIATEPGAPKSKFVQGNDSVKDLGNGANMNGLTGSDGGYDAGVAIGSSGIGKNKGNTADNNDVQSFSFTLSSSLRDMTLADFANVDFGVRTTSVGTVGGSRTGSSKLMETTFRAIDAKDDCASVNEDASRSGNVLDNDRQLLAATDIVSVTGWTGGALGTALTFADTADSRVKITIRLNADGSYSLDANDADVLSAGEEVRFTFSYDARNQNDDTSWATDAATFTVKVVGVNDDPDANDDTLATINEGETIAGNTSLLLANDTDRDRLDTLTVVGLWDSTSNSWKTSITTAGGATVSLDLENGTFLYDPGSAFDGLNAGDTGTDSFEYRVSDGNGGYDHATVNVRINGSGSTGGGDGGGGSGGGSGQTGIFPTMAQAISNVVLYLDDGDSSTAIYKVKITPQKGLEYNDVDDLDIFTFIEKHAVGPDNQLVGISIHAGTEYPQYPGTKQDPLPYDEAGTANGEGPFYLVTPDQGYLPVGSPGNGGTDWDLDSVPLSEDARFLGLTEATLLAHANAEYTFTGAW